MTHKKPTDIIADAVEDARKKPKGENSADAAPLAETGKKLSTNQRRRKNKAAETADEYVSKDGGKAKKAPKKAAASGTTKRIDAAEKAKGDETKAKTKARKTKQDSEHKEAKAKKVEKQKITKEDVKSLLEKNGEAEKIVKDRDLQTQYNVTVPPVHGHGGGFYIDAYGDMHFWEADNLGLPVGCPVKPLGTFGDVCFYLGANGQIRELKARDHSRNNIAHMFGAYNPSLENWWPQVKRTTERDGTDHDWIVTGWKVQKTIDVLMAACDIKGIWNSTNKVRGLGAWEDSDGGLVYHCGDNLWSLDGAEKTGEYDGFIYPALTKLPAPWEKDVPADESPAKTLLDLFKTWNWERPVLDPILLMGWIGASIVSGALDWRPMIFVTGDAASGKSTIHKIVRNLFGDGLISTTDTTPAGIYQLIGQSCIPVAVDELEAEHDNNRAGGIIKLARLASSGSLMLRGGADHKGTSFKLYNCFMFSSILIPPLKAQDRSRMAILNLDTLDEGLAPPDIKADVFEEYGRKIKRRMIYKWPFFNEVLRHYQTAMGAAGHNGRAIDQFGTLLAAAHVMLSDDMPTVALTQKYMKLLSPKELSEVSNKSTDSEDCLNYLLQSNVSKWHRATDKSISELLQDYLDVEADNRSEIRKALGSVGVSITISVDPKTGQKVQWLAVFVRHKHLNELYGGTDWSGLASTDGIWAQALRRIDPALSGKTVKIIGFTGKCIKIPLYYIYRNSPDDLEKLLGFECDFGAEFKAQTKADWNEDAGIDPFGFN